MIVEIDEAVRLDREFVQDPHALYRRPRTEAPAHPVVMWVAFGHGGSPAMPKPGRCSTIPGSARTRHVPWRSFRRAPMVRTRRR